MNISYNWLKQYIKLEEGPEEVSKILTSVGLETGGIEEVQTVKGGLEGLYIGQVSSCVEHENSDHLHVTTVDLGLESPLQIVCGAANIAAGQKVVVATVGTTLYSSNDSFTIKKTKIRGVESFGMICAEDEIGVGTSHDGIIVLPEEAVVGMPAKEYYNVQTDYVLEVDITPNRADACSHYGVARDLAAYFSIRKNNFELKKPSVDAFEVQNRERSIPVVVENSEACPRYSSLTISGVKVADSPEWLQNYLLFIGVRPINNVVDVTNFVMFEMGQALHAFDADKIAGNEVYVKNLPSGTLFTTLDGVERKLNGSELMICDKEKPMCIGGVFGGQTSGVSEGTQNIFLESAYFDPVSIRKTARAHGLNTDASFRFERGCDPNNTIYVLKRAALLIQELAGGSISSEIADFYPNEIKDFNVQLTLQKLYSLVGKEIPVKDIETILKALEIEIVSKTATEYSLKVPPYRVDVQNDVDVIEDVLRIYGYNNIEIGESLKSTLSYSNKPDTHKAQQLISEQLTAQGFNEILNNSLTKGAYYADLKTYPAEKSVSIMNPLSSDLNVMRQSLLFGGLESIAYNVNRKNADLKFYEFGNSYSFDKDKYSKEEPLKAYSEAYHLGLWLTGNKQAQSWASPTVATTVFELKAYVENILLRMGLKANKLVWGEYSDDLFSEAMAYYNRKGECIVVYGTVSTKIAKSLDVNVPVYFADFNWGILLAESSKKEVLYKEIPKFPEVKRDLALLIDKNIEFAAIEKIAYDSERKLLKELYLFDVYEGKNLEAGKKSYAVSFVLIDENKTLTDKQIDGVMKKIQENLEKNLGAQLR